MALWIVPADVDHEAAVNLGECETMALTTDQRAELEALGPETVRFKLIQPGTGRGASVSGFTCGEITRGDIEDWLAEKYALQVRVESWTLWAAIVGAVAATIGVLIALFWK